MFILFGEYLRTSQDQAGTRRCVRCDAEEEFFHITEVNYFSLFAIPIFPMAKVADYFVCGKCETSYASIGQLQPSHIAPVKIVITYILIGYGMANEVRRMQEIANAIVGVSFSIQEVSAIRERVAHEDVLKLISAAASTMNAKAKFQVIEAAFLSTHVCCEMQYEDRLRINIIGNTLGVPITFVETAIQNVRANNYYKVRRFFQQT